MKHKIYLGLTTTNSSNWRDKITEIKSLRIEEVALFPTNLEKRERWELYRSLLETPIKYVPFVHLRHDSTLEEVDFFAKNFKTKLFNIHPIEFDSPLFKSFPNRKKRLFVENTGEITALFLKALKASAGICLDFSHWEDYGVRQKEPSYVNFDKILKANQIGFAHLTSVRDKPYRRDYGRFSKFKSHHCAHYMEKLADYDYLKKYLEYFPKISAVETENTLTEQLEIKEYIEKLLGPRQ